MAPNLKLKLLIDGNTGKVVIGEADREFVDFLFNFFAFPVGLVAELLTGSRMAGGIGNLHKSLKDLPDDYIQPYADKYMYLKPHFPYTTNRHAEELLLRPLKEPAPGDYGRHYREGSGPSMYYMDEWDSGPPADYGRHYREGSGPSMYYTDDRDSGPPWGEPRFLRSGVKYIVKDNLEVEPVSTITSVTQLNKVQNMSALVEKEVQVGMKEALALLKASLESQTVLTDVFGERTTSSRN